MPKSFEDRELLRFERMLRTAKRRAIPFAVQKTLNRAVVATRDQAKADVRKLFVVRRPWVLNSIRSQGTTTLSLHRMRAEVGTIGKELAVQEFGGRKRNPALPTSTASGEGKTAFPRRRTPKRGFATRDIDLPKGKRKGNRGGGARSRRQATVIAVKQAIARKQRFLFLDLGKTKGIFQPTKRGLRAVVIFRDAPVVIPKKPWLLPAVAKVRKRMPAMYFTELAVQLRRHGFRR